MRRSRFLLFLLPFLLIAVNAYSLSTSALTEMLQKELSSRNAFMLIERSSLSRVLDEQALELSGVVDNEATKIGQLVGADKIITGSLMVVDGKFVVLIKVLDVATGVVEFSEGIKVDKESKLEKAIIGLAKKIVKLAQQRWGASLSGMKFAVAEISDLRDPEPTANPFIVTYLSTVNATASAIPESYKIENLLSVDVLDAVQGNFLIQYEMKFRSFGFTYLFDLSFPAPDVTFFSFGFNYKFYFLELDEILHPYIGLGIMFAFNPLMMPVIGEAGIRLHPIPGWDHIFVEGAIGGLLNFINFYSSSTSGTMFDYYVTVKAGWKF